jgi:peptidoglycan/LPS O-acetylase OafA/YrhL
LDNIDIKGFYIRRISIWPVYFAFLAFLLVLKVIAAPRGISYSVLAMYAIFLGDTPRSSEIFISPILFPLWSISLEEQFYLTGVACWILSGLYIMNGENLYPISLTLAHSIVPIGCGALLLSATKAAWLRHAWLVYLGRISYGLYIYHGAALSAVMIVCASLPSGYRPVVSFSAGLALTIALAAVSYRWYESPFLQLKARYQHVPSLTPLRGVDEAMLTGVRS